MIPVLFQLFWIGANQSHNQIQRFKLVFCLIKQKVKEVLWYHGNILNVNSNEAK